MSDSHAGPQEDEPRRAVIREVDDRGGEVVHGTSDGDPELRESLDAAVRTLQERMARLKERLAG